ncbi:hypothetical protein K492DRAFT_171647 [Lichtheimia hyalospora FSU 10163]|nr:hypothetical protein K492DRAFT_171647 [Lichtheimia hyalospora FSU 10163]
MKDTELPLIPNLATIHYLRQAGAMLDLPARTTATAIIYYNQFHHFMLVNKNSKCARNNQWVDESMPLYTNEELLATTCLHLACKATDVPRKVRDLVNVGYRYYHPKENVLQVDETYFRMRSSLVTGELLLVRALSFDLEVTLPFTYCLHVLRAMAAVSWFNKAGNEDKRERRRSRSGSPDYHKDIWRHMEQEMDPELSTIARVAWTYCWDSVCSPRIILSRKPAEIALGCLYLALRTCDAELPVTINQWVDMWGTAENLSVQNIRDVVTDLLDLFDNAPSALPIDDQQVLSPASA